MDPAHLESVRQEGDPAVGRQLRLRAGVHQPVSVAHGPHAGHRPRGRAGAREPAQGVQVPARHGVRPAGHQGGAVPVPGAVGVRLGVRELVQGAVAGVAGRGLRHGPAHPAQLRRLQLPVEVQREAPAAVRGRRGDGAVLHQVPVRVQGREGRLQDGHPDEARRRVRRQRGGQVHGRDPGGHRAAGERGGGGGRGGGDGGGGLLGWHGGDARGLRGARGGGEERGQVLERGRGARRHGPARQGGGGGGHGRRRREVHASLESTCVRACVRARGSLMKRHIN
mmetsp:Transcript_28522/g.70291  ORF Transcript_28522/g.70291 Transcript_28522/m.70291 type:complete len:281 (+) Transcript_28522:609-1451(+)